MMLKPGRDKEQSWVLGVGRYPSNDGRVQGVPNLMLLVGFAAEKNTGRGFSTFAAGHTLAAQETRCSSDGWLRQSIG